MLVRMPRTVSRAREHLTEGAVPIGGATLVWATWLRDGFPEQAMSLRELPEANGTGPQELGGAVTLDRVDDRVPYALRAAAGSVGTGAVRRAATVGGNLAGSALRCLLPAALVLEARATVLASHGVYETDLAEVTAKRPVLLGLRWSAPVASAYRKLPGDAGGAPPLVVATALHAGPGGQYRLRAAVRDGYEVLGASATYDSDADRPLDELRGTPLADVAGAWDLVTEQVAELLAAVPGR
ncbi:FAD binding domain-containing protein [Streptomyces sp. NPDC018610]|uniref:FAD binding domain-containing protein n=1 Tax=Streptomyces sp. NPDC018610 TaxID=3365049 RepID=UPI0037A0B411